jgi:septum formation protein
MKAPLILASQSKVRVQMLLDEGLVFEVKPSPYDEDAHKSALAHLHPQEKSLILAQGKAEAVSQLYPSHYVIGADQICAMDYITFGKPHTLERATQTLKELQGKTHHQYSAACVYHQGQCVWSEVEVVTLHMHPLSDEAIENYLKLDAPFLACGAYRYEAHGDALFASVTGSAAAIKGLPLSGLLMFLQQH